ncbi:hypothetical protein HIM_07205 [Hirsutella minnesotensis 3608]|uniref:Uncharacterized protein n=1 Tax=Hirsutella minnesotensis 3608 TaxID=1043627 RepID=A0A0F7ZI45_9HYPO|nr:hypothetical protein HIM_07205 [Hirsutella minnesotensis 3608]
MHSFASLHLSFGLVLLGVGGLASAQRDADLGRDISSRNNGGLADPGDGYKNCENQCHINEAYTPVQLNVSCDAVVQQNWWDTKEETIRDLFNNEFGDHISDDEIDDDDLLTFRTLREWEKQATYETNSRTLAQGCLRLGPYYNGYMAACAPDRVLEQKPEDFPQHANASCDLLINSQILDFADRQLGQKVFNDFEREFINGGNFEIFTKLLHDKTNAFTDVRVMVLRQIEREGCLQGKQCKNAEPGRDCCLRDAPPSEVPDLDSYTANLYRTRYISKCSEASEY